jgi:hypothetical protein
MPMVDSNVGGNIRPAVRLERDPQGLHNGHAENYANVRASFAAPQDTP